MNNKVCCIIYKMHAFLLACELFYYEKEAK